MMTVLSLETPDCPAHPPMTSPLTVPPLMMTRLSVVLPLPLLE